MARLTITVKIVSDGAGQTEIAKSILARGDTGEALRDSRGRIVAAVADIARETLDLALQDYQDPATVTASSAPAFYPSETAA